MKHPLAISLVGLALCLQASAQPIYRNVWSTNPAPDIGTIIYGDAAKTNWLTISGGKLTWTNSGFAAHFTVSGSGIVNTDGAITCVGLLSSADIAATGIHTIFGSNVQAFYVISTNFIGVNLSLTGPALSTSASASNAPAGNEFPTAGWVRGLLAGQGIELYNTTNVSTVATNTGSPEPVYQFHAVAPAAMNVTFNSVTNNQYIGSTVTTNRFQSLSGPIVGNSWIFYPSGAGRSLTLHEEIYFSYDGTNWFGDYETGNQVITAGSTNLYSFLVAFPTYNSTNAAGFLVQKRRKVGIQTANPNVTIWVGTNTPSHMDLAGPNNLAGNAFLADNQTFTGTNTFTGTVRSTTVQKAPVYSNSTVGATSIIASFGLDETIVEVQTNAVSLASSQGRASNVVCFANFTLFNYCGSNATVTFNASWMPLGLCTNTLTLTNAKSMRVSVGFAGRAVAGWDSETNVFYGYAFQP